MTTAATTASSELPVPTLRERYTTLRTPRAPADSLQLSTGSIRDYAALCEFHYRARRPATVTRVLTLRDARPTVVGRFLRRPAEPRVVAVLVESLPQLRCLLRDHALGDRYAAVRSLRARARLLSAELRCISRVVVHPQFRGQGLAVRLVRAALADPATPFTEALAAMGHVNPFFAHAGMTPYHRPPHPFDQRLLDALASLNLHATDLPDTAKLLRMLDAPAPGPGPLLRRELVTWHHRLHRSTRSTAALAPPDILRAAQQRLLCQPVYYLRVGGSPNLEDRSSK